MEPPSTNGTNDRDSLGRFAKGNAGGPGNPHAAAVGRWRTMLAETVTPEDIRAVLLELVERARAGERWAVCELLDRCLGKPTQAITAAAEVQAEDVVLRLEFADRQLIPERSPASSKCITDTKPGAKGANERIGCKVPVVDIH